MTESATISSFIQAAGRPFAGAPRVRPEALPIPERRTEEGSSPSAAAGDRSDALPKPLLSSGSQLAAQEDGQSEQTSADETTRQGGTGGTEELTEDEKKKVQELQARDREVRAHEAAHKLAAGPLAGTPTFKTVRGPDGRSYAVSGEVKIDTSEVPNNPDATIRKMEIVKRAALAPSNPSAKDRQVAAEAEAKIQQARQEKREKEAEELEKANEAGAGEGGLAGTAPIGPAASGGSATPGALFNLVA
jgi:hypothetical protein